MEQRLFYETNNRSNPPPPPPPKKKPKKKKFNFNEKKKNTIKSLKEVECFLNDFNRFKRYMHLYKFFK